MGMYYETIPERLIEWCLEQKMFWVASAPLSGKGHVNVSPKGGDKIFGIPDNKTFWYKDLSGSGNETISHIYEPGNGRITIMFNAFEGAPQIIRFWGHGTVLEYDTPAFNTFTKQHSITDITFGTRSIIVVSIHQVGSSCGFSVPFYAFQDFRPVLLNHWAKREKRFKEEGKTNESMDNYWAFKNAWSMDGLPGMRRGIEAAREGGIEPIRKMVGPLAPRNGVGGARGSMLVMGLLMLVSFLMGIGVAVWREEMLALLRRVLETMPPNIRAFTASGK